MKIGIITIQNSSNYGAMLQTYALQSFLEKYGCSVEIINYDNPHMAKGLDLIRHGTSLIEIYYMILDLLNFRARKKMIHNFHIFSRDYLNLTRKYSKSELLYGMLETYDIYISGSDQIWNPNVTDGEVDDIYFCGMAQKGSKVISYASSFGGYDFLDKNKNEKIKNFLKKYSAISTREMGYIQKASCLTEKRIVKVMDPVFLLSKDEWYNSMNTQEIIGKPYILIYVMSKHAEVLERVLRMNISKNLDIIMFGETLIRKKNIHYVMDAGPKEFVNFFRNASFVVTNSFHGTAFSLIFNKNMCVLNNANNMNRIYDLLQTVNLNSILVKDINALEMSNQVDYNAVNQYLKVLIDKSKKYLIEEVNI